MEVLGRVFARVMKHGNRMQREICICPFTFKSYYLLSSSNEHCAGISFNFLDINKWPFNYVCLDHFELEVERSIGLGHQHWGNDTEETSGPNTHSHTKGQEGNNSQFYVKVLNVKILLEKNSQNHILQCKNNNNELTEFTY